MEIFDKEKEKKLQDWQNENEHISSKWQTENEQITNKWQENNEQIINKWKEDNRRIKRRWQKAMRNWNNLYYCHRDDCVFIPDKGTYAPIEKMHEYIYEEK